MDHRGGANVYPAEVERVIEGVDGVRAGADPRLGQRVVAVVETDPGFRGTNDDILEHCRTHLARYKVPEQALVIDELPRNSMGKVQRAQLADHFPAHDGASDGQASNRMDR